MITQFSGFTEELHKIASRAGIRQIRRLLDAGAVERAHAIAKTPGVVKATTRGSPIKDLGRGGETLATLVAKPDVGLAVRKLYDPKGIASPRIIGRKMKLAPALEQHPQMAKTYGFARTPSGGRMTFHEYVAPTGAPVAPAAPSGTVAVGRRRASTTPPSPHTPASMTELRRGLQEFAPGYRLADIRPANMVNKKVVDYLPFRKREFVGERDGRLSLSPAGLNIMGPQRKLPTHQLNRLMG